MVPLQARAHVSYGIGRLARHKEHTELLLDHLQDLLLIKLLRETLDRSQGLSTIALWSGVSLRSKSGEVRWSSER